MKECLYIYCHVSDCMHTGKYDENENKEEYHMAARIVGTGSYAPENVVTNDYLATVMDTSDEWISSKTGIRQRRISKGEGTVTLAFQAAKRALENAKVNPKEVDLIICATCSPDKFLPSTACEVQALLGAQNATCFDLSAACSGFIFALNTANAYISAGMANTVVIIGAETLSKIMDWEDRATCVLFGDGAGAAVVRKAEKPSVLAHISGADGSKGAVLQCKAREVNNLFIKGEEKIEYVTMDGKEVYKFAVTCVPDIIKQLLLQSNTEIEDVKYFVLHQANKRIIESVAKRLHVPMEKFPLNIDNYANTSAATIPILLDELNQKGMLERNDKIIIAGFGGGLTWGGALIEW